MSDQILPRPLEGIRVLDFTAVMAGPYTTRMLADLGADVIKIEPLEGDQVRARPPQRNGFSAYFGHLNAGKRSLAADLKDARVRRAIHTLAAEADIVVENYRPGVMQRLGLDYATLSAINLRLIYCSISGFGQTGERAQSPAYAPVIHAASGFDLANLAYQDGIERPATGGIFIADVLGGTHAFGAIQAALFQRERTGQGQFIDVAMLDAMIGMLIYEMQAAQFPGDGRRPLYSPLRTQDGFIMVAPTSPRNFEQLCIATGHPEWRDDPRFINNAARNANWPALLAEVEHWTSRHSAVAAETIFAAYGVPCSRYRSLTEVLADPLLAARGTFEEVTDGAGTYRITNVPFKMSGATTTAHGPVSRLGEHGSEVLRSAGLTDAEIDQLRGDGALL